MLTADPSLPSYCRPERRAVQEDLDLMADSLIGTRRMHEKNTTYIRKWVKEKDGTYKIRSRIENYFEGVGRTLSAAVGMLYAKPPSINWNSSDTLKPHYDNLDAKGTAFHVFAKRFTEKSIRDGFAVILVDHTPPPPGVDVVTEEVTNKFNLRPTWAMYERGQVLSWIEEKVNNKDTLTQVVFHEMGTARDGEYGVKAVHRYRRLQLVLTPDGYQALWFLHELVNEQGKPDSYRPHSSGVFKNRVGKVADFLPVSVGYAGRTDAAMTATMPLLGVAFANLAHYQQSTDLRFYRSLCAFPQRKITGNLKQVPGPNGTLVPAELPSGPMAVLSLEKDATASWDELEGKSMDQLEKGIAEKLSQIGQMGMAFLVPQTRQAETAEAKRIDAVAQNATLATAAQGNEDALNLSSEHHAWFEGIDKVGAPVVTINKDFESLTMDPAMMTAWATVCKETGFPLEWMIAAFVKAGLIPADTNVEKLADESRVRAEVFRQMEAQRIADEQVLQGGGLPIAA